MGTRHRPHSARSCVLWGRLEGARGGPLLPRCAASGVRRSPTPDCPPSGRSAGDHYPLAVGAGGCGRGDRSRTPQRALLRAGFARCGGGTRAPGGGASCLGVGRPGSGALPPPTARPLGGLPGPTTHWLLVRGGAGVGTRHQPHSARSCELALRAVGAARGRPGGARLLPGCGASRVGRSPIPDCPPSGRAAGVHYPLAVGPGGAGVQTRHQPHSARSCVLWGRHEGALGGRLLPGCGASGVGRSPTPDCLPSGRAAGAHYPLAVGGGGCGRGDPSPTPQRALLQAGFACCGGGMRVPGGGASCLCVGRPGSGALPPPTARPLGGLPGPTTHWLWVRGGAGTGTRHQPHSAQSQLARARAVGAARGRPGGGPPVWVWGVRGRALSHPRPPVLSSVRPGPASHWPWVRCAGVGARLSLAPCPVPRFVVCCARFPGSRHPVAFVAWHLSSCRGCGRRRASLACLMAPRWCAAPRPVRSLSVLRSAFPSPWCLPPPQGLSPPALLGGCAGHVEAGREPSLIAFHLTLCGVSYTADRHSPHRRVERAGTGVHWRAADASVALHIPG